jgi:3D (Asp-Asp-Asp) domain-containing protein
VTISAYHPPSRGINSDKDPSRTATMTRPIAGRTIAISTELVELGWLGKKIYINGHGVYYAESRMEINVKGKRIDICAPTLKWAKKFGIKKDVLAIVLN